MTFTMGAAFDVDLVHAPLAHWAQVRPDAIAITDGDISLTFADLNQAVQQRASALSKAFAPATVFVDDALSTLEQTVDFLGIIVSGRCAAVGDPDWPASLRDAVQASISQQPYSSSDPTPTSPFYIGFTSGSTGRPKGFQRNHQSWTNSFRVCVQEFGEDAAKRILAPGRFSHSLFLFGMMLGIWSGSGVVVQKRFSVARALDALRDASLPSLVAVPSQLLLMIELATHRALTPFDGVRLVMISGARWPRNRTPELQSLFPNARLIEFYGASEMSFIAWMEANEATPPQVVGRPFRNVDIEIRDIQGSREKDASGAGLIYVRSPMLFMDYVGTKADITACLRDGEWLSVRDMGYLDDQGRLCLLGRQNRMIVTQAKKLFPEELESVLQAHPSIAAASVHGLNDPLRGLLVVAVIHLVADPSLPPMTATQLTHWCRDRLEVFKAPRHYFVCDDWRWTASGKTDHNTLGSSLVHHMDGVPNEALPCLHPLC